MRLSEAIMLGDMLKKPDGGRWLGRDGDRYCGCALGGAALAAGFGEQHLAAIGDLVSYIPFENRVHAAWPWINAVQRMRIGQMYMQVAAGKIAIEQLVDYVRSIEPAEAEATPAEQPRETVAVG